MGTLFVICQLRNTAVCFMFHYNNQTDQGDETQALERDGLTMCSVLAAIQVEAYVEQSFDSPS